MRFFASIFAACVIFFHLTLYASAQQCCSTMGVTWDRNNIPVPVVANENGSADINDGSDIEALRLSAETWSGVSCSIFSFSWQGTTSSTAAGQGYSDGKNLLVWREINWPSEFGSYAIAVTTPLVWGNKIVDADILFNGQHYQWTTTGSFYRMDIQNIATHEMGHMLGLNDVYNQSCWEATMFGGASPGETYKRTLSQSDIDCICGIYPGGTPGGCGSSCVSDADCGECPICLDVSGSNYCSKSCSSDGDCPSGFYCDSYNDSPTGKACFLGSPCADIGERCDYSTQCCAGGVCLVTSQYAQYGECYRSCDVQRCDCPEDQICYPIQDEQGRVVGGACATPPVGSVPEGGTCNQYNHCQEGMLCIYMSEDATSGTCFRRCNPQSEIPECEQGLNCYPLGGIQCLGVCAFGDAQEGESCSNRLCAPGLICAGPSEEEAVCYRWCDPDNPQCYAGEQCYQIDQFNGICVGEPAQPGQLEGEQCSSSLICEKGLVCIPLLEGMEEGICRTPCDPSSPNCEEPDLCLPVYGVGYVCMPEGEFGDGCDSDEDCQSGICFSLQSGGICTIPCDPDTDNCPEGYDCINLGNSEGLCAEEEKPISGRAFGSPCTSRSDCITQICISDGKGGYFCSQSCNVDEDCPEGYICSEIMQDFYACSPSGDEGGKFGDDCNTDEECQTGLCLEGIYAEKYCSTTCEQSSDCPSGYDCIFRGGIGYCFDEGRAGTPAEPSCGCLISPVKLRVPSDKLPIIWIVFIIVLGILLIVLKLKIYRNQFK